MVSVTARRNGLSTSQLFTWRRLARHGRLSAHVVPALPVEITPAPSPASISTPQPAPSSLALRATTGIIEIELGGGYRVRVHRDVDGEALGRVLELLRRR
ncbi:transposase [Bradyrhizobium yuanmingense]